MSTGEIIASVLGEFEDFLRKVGRMEIFDTLVYNYRLKPSMSNLTPELFTDLFSQLLDKLLYLKNNLLHWHSIQEFTLSPFQATLPISVANLAPLDDVSDVNVNGSLSTESAIVSSIVTEISNNPYSGDFDLSSHIGGCPSSLDVSECTIPAEIPLLKTICSQASAIAVIANDNKSLDTNHNDNPSAESTQPATTSKSETKKSFLCQTCGKKYSTVQSLTAHLNVHTKSKIFKCSFCGKVFMRKDKLMFHEAVHTGVKSFTCEICGKSFARKTKLDEHLRRHSGLKNYKCLKCSKSYTSNRDLRKHLLKQNCNYSTTFHGDSSVSNGYEFQEFEPMRTQHLEEDEDVTITQEVSEIFKLNWPDLQFPPEVEPQIYNLDNNYIIQ